LAAAGVTHDPRMTFTVDLAVVKQHRLGLLAQDVELHARSGLDPPEAGPLSRATEIALGHVGRRADRLGEELREVADALLRWAELTASADAAAASTLDLVMAGVMSS
jgi:hypothetical protein